MLILKNLIVTHEVKRAINSIRCKTAASLDWKPMNSIALGVKEIRIHTSTECRVIYIAKFAEAVYVLHAFTKKTQQTNQRDIDLAKRRFAKLVQERNSK